MTPEDKERIIKHLMILLWKNKDLPPRLQAERILIDCLEKELDDIKDIYQRLMLMDTSKEN